MSLNCDKPGRDEGAIVSKHISNKVARRRLEHSTEGLLETQTAFALVRL